MTEIPGNNIENPEIIEPIEDISQSDALTGLITEPAETFEEIKKASKQNYWILPIIILIVITIAGRFLIMNDQELSSEIKTQTVDKMRKNMQEKVKEGKMSQEQMDQAMERMEQGFSGKGAMFIVFSIIGPVFAIFIFFFVRCLIVWGSLKIFKGTAAFTQIMSVLGLASIITAIQMIVNTVLAIFTGHINANLGAGLIIKSEMMTTTGSLAGHLDLLTFWYLIVAGTGLARVSNLKSSVTISVLFGLWIIWVLATSFLPIPFMGR